MTNITIPTEPVSRDEAFRYLYGVMAEMREIQEEIANLEAARRAVLTAHDDRLVRLEARFDQASESAARLAEPLLPRGSKHVDIPGLGRVQFRDYQAGVRVADPRALLQWAVDAERTDLYERVPRLLAGEAKKAADAALASDGELLPGVERVEARRVPTVALDVGLPEAITYTSQQEQALLDRAPDGMDYGVSP